MGVVLCRLTKHVGREKERNKGQNGGKAKVALLERDAPAHMGMWIQAPKSPYRSQLMARDGRGRPVTPPRRQQGSPMEKRMVHLVQSPGLPVRLWHQHIGYSTYSVPALP